MRATGIEFKWCAGQQPEDDAPAAASGSAPKPKGSSLTANSVADMKSNVFRMKKFGFDVSKHICLKKGSDATYKVITVSEDGVTAQQKLHGAMVGAEVSMAWLQPPRRPGRQGTSYHEYNSFMDDVGDADDDAYCVDDEGGTWLLMMLVVMMTTMMVMSSGLFVKRCSTPNKTAAGGADCGR